MKKKGCEGCVEHVARQNKSRLLGPVAESVVFSQQTNRSRVGMTRPGNIGSVQCVQICPNKPSQQGNILQSIPV